MELRDSSGFIDLTDDGDEEDVVLKLRAENAVLQCENRKAQSEVVVLKQRVEKLEVELQALRGCIIIGGSNRGFVGDLPATGTPSVGTPDNCDAAFRTSVGTGQVRKRLSFHEIMSRSMKMAPLTPAASSRPSLKDVDGDQFATPDVKEKVGSVRTLKRKRAANVISSDSETDKDEDDDILLSQWQAKRVGDQSPLDEERVDGEGSSATQSPPSSDDVNHMTTRRRRLVKVKEYENEIGDSETEESGSVSEDESSSGFIDDGDTEGDGDESDVNRKLDKILSKLSRRKDQKNQWELEGEMLAEFGKDPELCMKAVCALYRQQTCDEQLSKETVHQNGRGFSKFDALRGTAVAEFLLDGNPGSDVVKSVEELEEYDSGGVELCRTLATHYSKQLFQIYKNEEDPFFRPR